MKILILTQPLVENYGGILQNYALQILLKRRGHDVKTLKTKPILNFYKFYLFRALSLVKHFLLLISGKSHTGVIRQWLTQKEEATCYKQLAGFIQNNLDTTPMVKSYSNFKKYLDYDAYVVGSDQVWRKEYSPHISAYFLSFLPKICSTKRIAYAASFGNSRITYLKKHIRKYSELLQRFDAVSVREPSAKVLCREHFAVDADVVPDPTLMLSADDYRSLLGQYKDCAKNKLVTYILDETPAIRIAVEKFAAEHHLEVVRLRGTYFRKDFKSPNPEKAGIEFWLGAIESAEYVITDSFHGTVFSLLFHKKFYSFVNYARGKDRFDMLGDIFGIKDRYVSSSDADINSAEAPDYDIIEEKLINYRKTGEEFLQKAGL